MMTLFFIVLLMGISFFAGHSLGVQQGYDKAMAHLNHVVDRLEKLYSTNLARLEKIIRDRIINKP